MCLQLYCFISCKLGTHAVKAPGESHGAVRCLPRVPLEAGAACRVGASRKAVVSSLTQSMEEAGCGADCKKKKSLDFIVALVCRAKAEDRKSWPGHAALCKHADLCQDTWACQAQAHLCLPVFESISCFWALKVLVGQILSLFGRGSLRFQGSEMVLSSSGKNNRAKPGCGQDKGSHLEAN